MQLTVALVAALIIAVDNGVGGVEVEVEAAGVRTRSGGGASDWAMSAKRSLLNADGSGPRRIDLRGMCKCTQRGERAFLGIGFYLFSLLYLFYLFYLLVDIYI